MALFTKLGMDERRTVQAAYDEMGLEYDERVTTESMPEPVARFCEELDSANTVLNAGCGGGDPTTEDGEKPFFIADHS